MVPQAGEIPSWNVSKAAIRKLSCGLFATVVNAKRNELKDILPKLWQDIVTQANILMQSPLIAVTKAIEEAHNAAQQNAHLVTGNYFNLSMVDNCAKY
jgi:hypothetical protein